MPDGESVAPLPAWLAERRPVPVALPVGGQVGGWTAGGAGIGFALAGAVAGPVAATAAALPAVPFAAAVAGFAGTTQLGEQWCWVACAEMMARARGIVAMPDGSPLTQCRIFDLARLRIAAFLDRQPAKVCTAACCPRSGVCGTRHCIDPVADDTRGVLSLALAELVPPERRAGIKAFKREQQSPSALAGDIRRQIAQRQWPVGILLNPAGAGADVRHYMLITGYDQVRGEYILWDPAPTGGGQVRQRLLTWNSLGTWLATVLMEP